MVEESLQKEIDEAVEQAVAKPVDESPEQAGDKVSSDASLESSSTDTETEEKADVKGEATDDATKPTAESDSSVAKAEIAQPVIGDDAIVRAIHAGFSPADVRSFPNEEALLRVVARIESTYKATEKVVDDAGDDKDTDLLASLPKLDPDVYETDVVKMYDSLVEVIRKQQNSIKSLQSNQGQIARANQESAARDTEKWFDEQVNKLGEDFRDVLGKGGYRTLQPGSIQHTKRDAIANQAAALIAGYRAIGQSPTRDEVFSQAARLVLGSEYAAAQEKKLTADLAKRSTQHISRANPKGSKSKGDPISEVAAMLDEKYFGKT